MPTPHQLQEQQHWALSLDPSLHREPTAEPSGPPQASCIMVSRHENCIWPCSVRCLSLALTDFQYHYLPSWHPRLDASQDYELTVKPFDTRLWLLQWTVSGHLVEASLYYEGPWHRGGVHWTLNYAAGAIDITIQNRLPSLGLESHCSKGLESHGYSRTHVEVKSLIHHILTETPLHQSLC